MVVAYQENNGYSIMKESTNNNKRCEWCGHDDLYVAYHDTQWGVPTYDDQKLFEFLILEGMQAGLSWITILRKQAAFQQAFSDFNAEKIARFSDKKVQTLMQNKSIIRNRLKIESVINNAKAYLKLKEQCSFSDFLWQFVDGKPIQNAWRTPQKIPANTAISDAMAKSLKQNGFKFVGTTICYAFMQAVGMVNDHVVDCFRHKILLEK